MKTYALFVKMRQNEGWDAMTEAGQPIEFATLSWARAAMGQLFAGEGNLGDLYEVYGNDWDVEAVRIVEMVTVECKVKGDEIV